MTDALAVVLSLPFLVGTVVGFTVASVVAAFAFAALAESDPWSGWTDDELAELRSKGEPF